ncbi:MAG: capsular polysaccharide synthesis protein [Lachnospiraceae bacterium]|nr:capsular polysaccharide synthesis protein [Lachnospiraceae bacterium]
MHYCWLSGEPFPELIQNCINSWKEHLTDYEFVLWDTKKFDVNSCPYVKQAFDVKKYAFASDYIRLYALYNYGGIYLDSDIQVFKNFDDLLNQKGFLGFESEDTLAGWILASEKGNPLFKEFLDYYNDRNFVFPDGHFDLTPNGNPITEICVRKGLKLDNTLQKFENVTIYPRTYFCPVIPNSDAEECYSVHTYAQHLFNAGWVDVAQKELLVKKREIQKKRGTLVALIYYGVMVIKQEGIFSFFRRWKVRRTNQKISRRKR